MEIVNEIPADGRGRGARGHWLKFADGSIRRLDRGIDFQCRPNAYATCVRNAMKRYGLTGIATARKDSVFVQIDPPARPKAVGE